MQIQRVDQGDVTILQFEEDEQLRDPEMLQAYLYDLMDEKRYRLLIDIENVRYISSSVLGLFITICKSAKENKGEVKIVNAQPSVSNVFRMTRLDRVFEMFNDRDSAIQSFN